jgi:hypothetical protein
MLPPDAQEDRYSLHYRLFIDGEERWDTIISTPPAPKGGMPGGSIWDVFKWPA